jgi:hypothetical protein
MKFTKEQAHQVLYLYDANLDNVQLAPTRVDTMLHALNEVFADLPAPAPQPAPKTLGQVAFELFYKGSRLFTWGTTCREEKDSWEAIAQAVLAAAQADRP